MVTRQTLKRDTAMLALYEYHGYGTQTSPDVQATLHVC